MKRSFGTAAALLVLLCGLTAGCAKQAPESAPSRPQLQGASVAGATSQIDEAASEAPENTPASDASRATSDASASASDASDASQANGPQQVRGTIADVGMGKYYVELEDGRLVGFDHEGADVTKLTDTGPGAKIVVTYTGVLVGTDTSAITVVRMETP